MGVGQGGEGQGTRWLSEREGVRMGIALLCLPRVRVGQCGSGGRSETVNEWDGGMMGWRGRGGQWTLGQRREGGRTS